MSACNIALLPNAVHLWADGAAYDEDGYLTSLSSKIRTLPSIQSAMIATGRSLDAVYYATRLEKMASSYDDLRANVSDWWPDIVDEWNATYGEDTHSLGTRLVFGGWSDRTQSCAGFAIATFDNGSFGAYEVRDITGGSQSPVLSEDELILGWGRRPTMDDIKSIDYMAVTSLELQRRQPFPCGNFLVGGFAELVTVTKDAITSRILKRWPEDTVGELIAPKDIDWDEWRAARTKVAIPDGLSRLQRERYEKKAKKGKLAA